MKILIDARLYGLENAGLGRYVMNLIAQLQKVDRKNKYTVLLRKKYFESLKMPKNWQKILADWRHYSFAEQTNIPRVIANQNPGLVHFPHFNVPLAYKGKYVVTIHDILMHKQKGRQASTLSFPKYLVKRAGYKTVFAKAVKGAAKVIVPSNFAKKEVTKYYKINPNKIVVTYLGVDMKVGGNAKVDIEKPYFLYVGNAYPHKNLERAIEAAWTAKLTLAIASSRGVFTQRLERIIKKFGAEEYVKLLGFVPDDKLGSLYQNAAAFVCPSTYEGFGLPGLEAMAVGTPVIASDIPVFKEIYGDNALYFNPYDFSVIAKAMQSVLEMSEDKRKNLISKAKTHAAKFTWQKMARETLEVYNSVT